MADEIMKTYYPIIAGGLRSIAASIPYLASLGQAWNEYETQRTVARINELLANLQHEFDDLREDVEALGDSLKPPSGFPELLEITVEKVRKEFEESKRRTYAHLLAKLTIAAGESSYEEMAALIDSLDTLSDQDLQVLALFRDRSEMAIKDLRLQELGLAGDRSEKVWQVTCNLTRLESRGLIVSVSRHTGVLLLPEGMDKDAARQQETKYRVLPLGVSLIKRLFC